MSRHRRPTRRRSSPAVARLIAPARMTRMASASLAPLMLVALLGACASDSPEGSATDATASGETLFTDSPPAWFEAYFTSLEVSPDGRRALFDYTRLIDLDTGSEIRLGGGLEEAFLGTFDRAGRPVVAGRLASGETGWFRIDDPDGMAGALPHIPPSARPVWSPSGALIAYVGPPGPDGPSLQVGPADGSAAPTPHPAPGAVSAVAWGGTDSTLLLLVPDRRGLYTLYALDLGTDDTRTVGEGLDGYSGGTRLAVSDDGGTAYLALASDGVPEPTSRHEPDAARDLDIYALDLATGALRPVVETSAEELAPVVADGALYWESIETRSEAVVVPAEGGETRVVAEGVQGPTWRTDSRAIGVTTGGWRLADWALNLDGGVVEIDADGRPTGPVTPIITGYHEDFSPTWSPDGKWIAYHSHRSPTPVARYGAEGSTDDIYLRRPDAPTTDEIRLTDFGWEVGTPDWAPDGRRLLMDSWDREREPGSRGGAAWIVEIDPETGAPVGQTRIPSPADAPGIPAWGAWSPAREEIALTFALPRSSDVELWVIAPDGASPRRVIAFTGNQYGGVDWSADGETLVYSALVDGHQQLFAVPRSGGEPRQLTHDAANLFHPQVSPDGRWIAATRIRHTKRIVRRDDGPDGGERDGGAAPDP